MAESSENNTQTPILGSQITVETLQTAIEQFTARGLSAVIPKLVADMVAGFGAAGLREISGGTGGPMDNIVKSNVTGEGLYQKYQDQRRQSIADAVGNEFLNNRSGRVVEQAMRVLRPEQDWLKENGYADSPESRSLYNQFIDNTTRGIMSKPFAAELAAKFGNVLGLGDFNETGKRLGDMAATIYSQASENDPLMAGSAARAAARHLFTERDTRPEAWTTDGSLPQRDVPYNKDAWGGFDQSSVAALGAHMARFSDFMGGVDLGDPAELSRAIEHMREVIQQYANALSSLRDVFGDGMPQIIKTLEGSTGLRLNQMGIARVGAMADSLASRNTAGYDLLGNGQYSLGDLIARSNTMMDAARHPLPSAVNYSTADRIGLAAMDLGQGTFGHVSLPRWKQDALDISYQTGNSNRENNIALAYSLWAEKQARPGMTAEELSRVQDWGRFQDTIAGYRNNGLSASAAYMRAAGVNNYSGLSAGYGLAGYYNAKTSGDAAAMAREDLGNVLERSARFTAARSGGLMNALMTGLTGDGGLSRAEAMRYLGGSPVSTFELVNQLQRQDTTLFSMADSNERLARLESRSGLSHADAVAANTYINYVNNGPTGSNLQKHHRYQQHTAEERRAREQEAKAKSRRAALDKVGKNMQNVTMDELRDPKKLISSLGIPMSAVPAANDNLYGQTASAAISASNVLLGDASDSEAVQARRDIAQMFLKGLADPKLAGTEFERAIGQANDARLSDEERRRASLRAYTYAIGGGKNEKALNALFGGNKLTDEDYGELEGILKEGSQEELSSFINDKRMDTAIGELDNPSRVSALYDKYKSGTFDVNADTWKEFYEQQKKTLAEDNSAGGVLDRQALEQLNEMFGGLSGDSTTGKKYGSTEGDDEASVKLVDAINDMNTTNKETKTVLEQLKVILQQYGGPPTGD